MAADIMTMYITALNKEKIWTLLGPEFGKNRGSSSKSNLWTKVRRYIHN